MDRIFADDLYKDEVVLITGGGTGIGLSIGREMGLLGASVAICGRREEPLVAAREQLQSEGIAVHHATCDIRESESIDALVDSTVQRFGKIDILINNAGGQFPAPAQMIQPKGFNAVVRNNLLGTWAVTYTVANKCFIPQKRGRIINMIANIARGFPGMAHTGAARAGVENLTKTLAVEWAQFGVRVNAIAPGVIVTTGTRQYPPELLDTAERACPMKRLGTAEEVSHLATYLASRYADYVTGQTIYIDVGASLFGDQWHVPDHVPQFPPYPIPGRENR